MGDSISPLPTNVSHIPIGCGFKSVSHIIIPIDILRSNNGIFKGQRLETLGCHIKLGKNNPKKKYVFKNSQFFTVEPIKVMKLRRLHIYSNLNNI